MSGTWPVAIVGGGISGLAAALGLARARVPFVLVESAPRLGGRIVSERVCGFLVEGGPDSLLAPKPAAIALCRELGLGDRLVPARDPRTVFVVRHGRLHALPPGMAAGAPTDRRAFLASHLFSWPGKVRMGLERMVPARRDVHDESIAHFFRRRLGREALALVGDPLLAGIHAGDPERLSLQATMPRLLEIERKAGSLSRGLAPATAGPAGPMFYALRDGLGELVDAIVRALPSGSCRAGTAVRRIARAAGGYEIALDGGEVLRARDVILAVPPPTAARLLADMDAALAAELGPIPVAGTATVSLGFRREDVGHPLNGHGLLIPRAEGLRTTACTFLSSKYAHRAPEGHVLLRAFVGGVRDPEAAAIGPDALAATVLGELGSLLDLRAAPCLVRVCPWPDAMPQMEVGHLERIEAFDRDLARLPGVSVIGAGLRGTGIADAVTEGLRTAQVVAHHQERRSA